MIVIRPESAADRAGVRHVNELGFGRPNEAALVDALRAAAQPQISLVAVEGGQVVGHIFFSPVTVESAHDALAPEPMAHEPMALGPMAVLPEHQRQGIGSRLVRLGLTECERLGHGVVVVLGHPRFYPRFGFSPAITKGLRCEYHVPDEVFMAIELMSGALRGRAGLVKYRPEFAMFRA
jgi:putative acetyltransferase